MTRLRPEQQQPGESQRDCHHRTALWDMPRPDERLPHARPARPRNHILGIPRARLSKEAQQTECEPTCMICGKAEGRGLCSPRCSVLCANSDQPGLAEVCLVVVRVVARLAVGIHGYEPGRKLAVVDRCPTCERTHWHAPTLGTHYRTPPCGQPYIVTLSRPRIDPRTGLNATQATEQRPDDHQRSERATGLSGVTTATRGAAVAPGAAR